jgi:outer membrane receptor for ferrienterochelin and colicins
MNSRLRTWFFAMLALCLYAAAPASAQTGTITGVVRDADTGRSLGSARVAAVTDGGRVAAAGVTNADGRYRLVVPAGSYAMSVESVGYEAVLGRAVTVAAGGMATADLDVRATAFQLNPVVVTASKRVEKATDAPARVEVVTEQDIRTRPTVTPTDHLRSLPGIDVVTQGVQSTNVVARGFNNIFSGALHTITDHRLAGVPSLRVNVLHFIPLANEDLQRIEVVLGPGSALYGPNTASGVLHMITKSPLLEQGTTVSLMGGERSLFQGGLRTAQRVNDRIGVKLSGSVLRGTEWDFIDTDEVAERAKFAADPFFRQDMIRALGVAPEEADRRIALIGARDNDFMRLSGEARVDVQVTPELTTVFQAGMTNVSSGIELTGLGAAQIEDWRYGYYQARANWNRFFAQAYLNTSNAGSTYLLRTGQPIVDESVMFVSQLQHGFQLGGRQGFTYGLDYFWTDPRTLGTVNGIYEDVDRTTEIGAYLQSETALMPRLDLVLAGRVDSHDALPDPIFSPRAALVYRFAEERALRVTFNRAFSTPSSINQFLDLPTSIPNQAGDPSARGAAQLGYSVRVQGTGTTGFTFQQPNGEFVMRSPFTPTALGGPATLLPAQNAAMFFPAAVQVVAQQAAARNQPLPANLVQYLASLQPTSAQIGTMFLVGTTPHPIAGVGAAAVDVAPIRETTTTSYEVGYKGVVQRRFMVAADVWFSRIQDFVTPLTVRTPLLTLNGAQIGAYLVPRFMQDLGMSQAEATALAGQLAPGLASVPVGVISSPQVNANGAQLLATYTNVNEAMDLWGSDLTLQALISPQLSLSLAGSIVSDDAFDTTVGIVTLNAPKRKGSLALEYREVGGRLNGEARLRHHASFPVRSGVYEAYRCVPNSPDTAPDCVEAATLLDLTAGYTLPQMRGATLQLSVQNALDHGYQSYPGVPSIGRMALLRLRYEF